MNVATRITALALLLAIAPAQAGPRPLLAAQSRIEFSVKEMGVTVSGQFRRFDADIDFDPAKPAGARVAVTVDIASLTTGDDDADRIALDKPWLDRAGFPKASFVSSAVSAGGGTRYLARGRLTIRGVSREISVPLSAEPQPDGGLLARGGFTVRRADFGIGGGEWNEGGVVADEVPVTFSLRLGPAAP